MKNRIIIVQTISIVLIFFHVVIFGILLSGCGEKDKATDEHSENHSDGNKHEDEHGGEVSLTEDQIKLMGIELAKFEKQNISGYIKVNGEIMMNQDNESKVGSIIPGRVHKIYVKEGSYVRAGQTLAIVENPDLINVQVEYINAKNEYQLAKQEYERQLKLSGDNIGSKKNLAEVESNYKRALANYKTLEEKLSSYKISKNRFTDFYTDTLANLQKFYSVTAPISGNVVSRMVTVGQYVEPSADLFHIVNTSTVYVDLKIFEKDLQHVSVGQRVELETGTNAGKNYSGKISFINKIFDDKDRTIKVRVSINNSAGELYPFMFVTAKIFVEEGSVMSVPLTSVESEGESKFVFVKTNETKEIESHENHQEEDEHKDHDHGNEKDQADTEHKHEHESGIVFKKIQIATGISDGQYIEVFPIGGLEENDEVVSKGTFYLKSEMKKEELGGHEH